MRKSIGLDLDGVLVGLPPFTSPAIIETLYKDQKAEKLSYRFPGIVEQKIRRFSHLPFVRPPIEPNCSVVKKTSSKYELYLVTGRYGFLEDLTVAWLKKYNLYSAFKKIYINTDNMQPHIFKSEIIAKLKLNAYIEDDFDSIMYCATRNKKTHFYYYTNNLRSGKLDISNVTLIKNLSDILV